MYTIEGEKFKLSECSGKYVFLDFWGTWCGPCKLELPNIIRMAELIPPEKLLILGIARDDAATLQKFLKERPLPYPNVLYTDDVLKAWGIQSFPTTFLINPSGKVIAKNIRGAKLAEKVKEKIDIYENPS